MVRNQAVIGLAIVALMGVPSGSVASAAPERYSFEASFAFAHPYLSQQCGPSVIWSRTGTDRATIWHNDAGLVVRELDHSPASKITISAPWLGTSFTTVRSTLSRWDYGDGAELGSTVTVTAHGLFGDVPGQMAAEAGTTTIVTTVTRFTPEGVPMTDPAGASSCARPADRSTRMSRARRSARP